MITDRVMPGMNGVQLAAVVREMRAGHPVILLTGFAAGSIDGDEELTGIDLVVRQPVPRRALRSVMGG